MIALGIKEGHWCEEGYWYMRACLLYTTSRQNGKKRRKMCAV
jgi:hypothetical protein